MLGLLTRAGRPLAATGALLGLAGGQALAGAGGQRPGAGLLGLLGGLLGAGQRLGRGWRGGRSRRPAAGSAAGFRQTRPP
jgi:hypothetical protein